jgi:hypothetical protein
LSESSAEFLSSSVKIMEITEQEIRACLGKLTEEQIWHRGAAHENSIANLLLHLEGNLRQWFLHGIDNQLDVRQRDAEFVADRSMHAAEVLKLFSGTLAECRAVVGGCDPERLQDKITPQRTGNCGTVTILEAIYRVVGHLQMHTGQIILLTKQMVGRDLDLTIPRGR